MRTPPPGYTGEGLKVEGYQLRFKDPELALETGQTLLAHVEAAEAETPDQVDTLVQHAQNGRNFLRAVELPGSIGTAMTPEATDSFGEILLASKYPRVREIGAVIATQVEADQVFDQIIDLDN